MCMCSMQAQQDVVYSVEFQLYASDIVGMK